jgi:hypothetical protein
MKNTLKILTTSMCLIVAGGSASKGADYTVQNGSLLATGLNSNLAAFNGHYAASGTSLMTIGYDTTNDCSFIRSETSQVAWKPLKLSASSFSFNFGWQQLLTLTSDAATQTTASLGTSSIPALLNVLGSSATGTGVTVGEWGQAAIGRYNDTRTNDNGLDHTTGVLVVGCGTSTQRQNAMRIMDDGTILIKPAGDISMGAYTNGPRP